MPGAIGQDMPMTSLVDGVPGPRTTKTPAPRGPPVRRRGTTSRHWDHPGGYSIGGDEEVRLDTKTELRARVSGSIGEACATRQPSARASRMGIGTPRRTYSSDPIRAGPLPSSAR